MNIFKPMNKEEVIDLFDKIAYSKIFNTLEDNWNGGEGTTQITHSVLKRYYDLNREKYGVETPFNDAIKYLLKDDYLQQAPKSHKEDPTVYRTTPETFYRYIDSIEMTAEKFTTLNRVLASGLSVYGGGYNLREQDILNILVEGFRQLQYKVPDNLPKLFYLLAFRGILVFDFDSIRRANGTTIFKFGEKVTPHTSLGGTTAPAKLRKIQPSKEFIKQYLRDTSWFNLVREEVEAEEMNRKLSEYRAGKAQRAQQPTSLNEF